MRAVALIAALAALSLTRAPVANAQTMNPRPIDNVGNNPTDVNAGTPNQPFLRLDVPTAYFADDSGTLFPGSTIITNTTTTNTTVYPAFQCLVAPPAPPTQPYPRCVSDLVNGYTATPLGQVTDVGTRSVRRVSHFETAWAQFLEYDIVGPDGQAELINIGIPTDDVAINTGPDGVSAAVLVTSNKSIEFYRRPSSIDPDTKKSDHVGLNFVTGFLDASPVYGSSAETLQTLRDGPGTHGKMKLVAQTNSTGELGPLPPLGQDGRFILGKSPLRSSNVYTASLTIIMLREHNRQCDRLYQLHGTSWTDDQYFNEARKWVIAFVQKVTSTEYLGILLGRPLPPYTGYRQDVKPGIDTFFATASFRYAHSAVSDVYHIIDENAQLIDSRNLMGIMNASYLLRKYDFATIIRSLALQIQEEIDVYYADSMRNYTAPNSKIACDTASLDHLRGRDLGLPLYNDARQAFGLPRKTSFADITKDVEVQKRLAQTYQSVKQVESFVGGLAEDHVAGASVGELFNASLWKQFQRLRDSDRFWYESPGMFTAAELDIIQHTSLRDIIVRNLADPATGQLQSVPSTQTYTASLNNTSKPNPLSSLIPANLWFVQPISSQSPTSVNVGNGPSNSLVDLKAYPYFYEFSSQYMIQWNTDLVNNRIDIALTLQSSQGWFGIGLNSLGALSMAGADFIVAYASPSDGVKLGLFRSQGNAQAPTSDADAYPLSNVNATIVGGTAVLVTFTRAMDTGVPGKAVFTNSRMNVIWAYNPQESNPTYHGGNRGGLQINFLSGVVAEKTAGSNRTAQLIHGIFMFGVWAMLFPGSIYIMRFVKHWEGYLQFHRMLQLIGSVSVAAVGAAAITAGDPASRTLHASVGLVLYCLIFVQVGMGLISNYSLQRVESVNTGLVLVIKKAHKYFGASLLIGSLINIYLGIITYDPTTILSKVYLGWLGLLVLVFVIKQGSFTWQGIRNRKKGLEAKAGEDKLGMAQFISDEKVEKLALISWEEFNERIASGALLVVVDHFVFDIISWVDSHPGGSVILKRANGTDITNDLLGLRGDTDGVPKRKLLRQNSVPVQRDRNEKDEFVFASELQQYLAPMDKARLKKSSTQVSGVNSKRANEGFFARLLPGGSVASTIDYVNSSFFQPGEIARHTHSDYAKRKLATMVTARIDNSDDGSAAVLQIPDALAHRKGRESPTGMFISPRPASGLVRTKATVPLTLRPPVTRLQTQFRRFVLIDKTNIAHGEHPVVAFTFAPVHALGEQYSVPTLPGQYVELMSQIRQETVKRPYNVVHGSVNTEFTIYVKIYANGKMSRHLDQDRQVKSEISVRGPFDITRRTPVEDLIWKRPADIDPNVVPRTDSIMLNPERADGRWRHAYAIVGGTGITPILQLIEHYQYIYKKEREQKSKLANSSTPPASDSPNDPPLLTWIHILIANRAVLDVIESAELETVAKHTGNRYLRVTISYVFSEPPEKWQGMKGLLNREKVEEWVRSCQEQAMSSTHNDRDSSTAAGVSGGPSEKSRDSVRKSHTIQDVMPGLGRASQVPAVSVTYAEEEEEEEEVRYKPGEDGSVASITLSRSSTAVGIETISGSLMGPDRQNVVLICGPDRMMENVKSILMEIDVEEIRERSWVITLY